MNNFSQTISEPANPKSVNTRIVLGVLCGAFLAALDTTILATVMPTIVGDFGGLSLYSWVFSIYMITTAVSMPLWGKMSDMFGRKNLFVITVGVFLLGSMLCGLSQSMIQLIIFRGIQGIGAGGLSAIPFALISSVFPKHERGKAIGFISSTWGISSVIGPLVGSFIAVNMSWRWVFYVNIPVGILATFLVIKYYKDTAQHHAESIDYLGGLLLASTIVALLLTSVQFGHSGTHLSLNSTFYLGGFVLLLVFFVMRERVATEPILHMEFFRRRGFWVGNVIGFLSSFAMYSVIAFMPLFSQSVQGGTATKAGLVITPMSLGWSFSSVVAGRLAHRFGERNLIRFGMLLMVIGFVLTVMVQPSSTSLYLILCVSICGVGMGCQTPALLLTVQNSVESKNLGVATSSQMLFRTIGGAVGVSVLGAVLAGSMINHFKQNIAGTASLSQLIHEHVAEPQQLLSAQIRSGLSADDVGVVLQIFTDGIHQIFFIGLGVLVVAFLLTFLLPSTRPTQTHSGDTEPDLS